MLPPAGLMCELQSRAATAANIPGIIEAVFLCMYRNFEDNILLGATHLPHVVIELIKHPFRICCRPAVDPWGPVKDL